ncbi:hypothetical protein BH20CHL6_BH20CHL6_09100 [soil metagenome]
MHVSPGELRLVQRDRLQMRFALLGDVACVLTELPSDGSAGTTLEELCEEAHWTVVLRGAVELHHGRHRESIPAGGAFYVPQGAPAHWLRTGRRTVLAGFVPLGGQSVDAGGRLADGLMPRLAIAERRHRTRVPSPVVVRTGGTTASVQQGRVDVDVALMGPWVYARATFGPTTGFIHSWCDLPHWGMVISGAMAIEWEDDVEVMGVGDVYWCPAGPPGHRFEVADAATTIDFTPRSAMRRDVRMVDWRPRLEIFRTRARMQREQRPAGSRAGPR